MPVKVTESSANIYTKISKIYFQPYAHTTLIFDDYHYLLFPSPMLVQSNLYMTARIYIYRAVTPYIIVTVCPRQLPKIFSYLIFSAKMTCIQGFSQKGVQPSYGSPFLEEIPGKFP